MTEPHIVLIEDNQDDFEAISRGFKACSIDIPIRWFNDSTKALEHFQALNDSSASQDNAPSVIILDLNMPGINGREVLDKIKGMENLNTIPTVVLTTSTDHNDVFQCYKSGVNTYIQKPVRFQDLKEACDSLKTYWFDTAILPSTEKK